MSASRACVSDILKSRSKASALELDLVLPVPIVLIVIDSIEDLLLELFDRGCLDLVGIDLLYEFGSDPSFAHSGL